MTGIRKVIAARMQESLANSAQLTITMKADITKLAALQKQLSLTAEERYGTKLTMTHLVSRAAVLALQAHPALNSFYQNERIITSSCAPRNGCGLGNWISCACDPPC